MGEGTGEGAGEAGAAGSFSSMVLLLLWLLSSGPEGLGLSFASSFLRTRPLGDAVVPRGDGGFGGRAWPGPGLGQGEAGLCQDVEGEDGRALDLGLREKKDVRTGGQSTWAGTPLPKQVTSLEKYSLKKKKDLLLLCGLCMCEHARGSQKTTV